MLKRIFLFIVVLSIVATATWVVQETYVVTYSTNTDNGDIATNCTTDDCYNYFISCSNANRRGIMRLNSSLDCDDPSLVPGTCDSFIVTDGIYNNVVPGDIEVNDSNFWVLWETKDNITLIDLSGNVETSINTTWFNCSSPSAIAWNNSDLWVACGDDEMVYLINSSLANVSMYDVSACRTGADLSISGLTTNNSWFFLLNNDIGSVMHEICRFDQDWTFIDRINISDLGVNDGDGITTINGSKYFVTYSGSSDMQVLLIHDNYTYPTMAIIIPTDGTETTNTGQHINYTATGSTLSECWWTIDDGQTNTSIPCGTNITNQTWSDAVITITLYANDTNNELALDSITFTVDTTIPSLNLVYPNGSTIDDNITVDLNYTAIDATAGLDDCWYNLDNTSNISISCLNTTFSTSEGTHTLYLYANDTVNNLAYTYQTFTISLEAPTITLDYPLNDSYISYGTNFPINYTANDPNGISECQIYHNLTGIWEKNKTQYPISGSQNYSFYNASDGVYVYGVWCNDTTTKGDYSVNKTFTIDSELPIPIISSITTTLGSQNAEFIATYSEDNCNNTYYSIYNSDNIIDGILENVSTTCSEFNDTFTVSNYGTFNLTIYVRDKAGNENTTSKLFTVTPLTGTPTGGSGGGGVDDIVCNESGEVWAISTSTGRSLYTFILPYKTSKPVERLIYLRNYGIDNQTVELRCEGEICDYVNISNKSITMIPNPSILNAVNMKVTIPETAKIGDEFTFNIMAKSEACEFALNNKAIVSRFSFGKYKLLKLSNINDNWDDIHYPVWIPATLAWITALGVGFLISRRYSVIVGFLLIGIVGGFGLFMMIMLL